MTVSTSVSTNTYNGNGITTVFPYTFGVLANTEILVQFKVVATGVITTKVLSTDYSVSGTGPSSSGGNVTFVVAPPTGTTVIFSRNSPYTQNIDYTEYDTFPAITHETGLDRGVILAQQLRDQVTQSLRFDPTINITPVISNVTAGYYFRISTDGTKIETNPISGITNVGLPGSVGMVVYDGSNNLLSRTLTGTANEITVTNGTGVAANPTFSLPTALTFTGKTVTGGTFTNITATFSTPLVVASGGTGRASHTAYALIAGGTTTTGAQQSLASLGTSGQVLTSAGAGALPTWSTPAVAATQSDMESATSNAVFVTPGTQHFHPAHPKVVARYTTITTTVNVGTSWNVASFTDNGSGDTTLNFGVFFSSGTQAAAIATFQGTAASSSGGYAQIIASNASSCRVVMNNMGPSGNTYTFIDGLFSVAVYGDL